MAEAIELVPYRPLGANERYCPTCGADVLRRAPDGTEYIGPHGEADCYRRQLVSALGELRVARAEADRWKRRHDALQESVIKADALIVDAINHATAMYNYTQDAYYESYSDGLDEALMILRQLLDETEIGDQ